MDTNYYYYSFLFKKKILLDVNSSKEKKTVTLDYALNSWTENVVCEWKKEEFMYFSI